MPLVVMAHKAAIRPHHTDRDERLARARAGKAVGHMRAAIHHHLTPDLERGPIERLGQW